jgi:hypothetical protein
MAQRFLEEIQNWFFGANTSTSPEMLPDGYMPRARNTHLTLIGDGVAKVTRRRGSTLVNSVAITGGPQVTGFQFKKKDGTKTNLLVSSTGRLDKLNTDGTTTVINASAFTSGASHIPNFAVANDLCFIVNDVDLKKTDGTNVYAFGITRPAAPTVADGGAGGAAGMVGTYDIALSYYNSATGHESSLSDFNSVTIVANHKINVSWSAPVDAQVTHVRVHIRKQALGPTTFRNISGATPAPDATTGGYAVATTATVLDVSDATIAAYIIVSPTISENNPPLASSQYPVWHNNRMFVFDSGNFYYSKIQNNTAFPEAFDPNNIQPVAPNDGDVIMGAFSQWGLLWIWKRFSLWKLDGSDPNSWTLSLVSTNHGAVSQRSIKAADGMLYWWDTSKGPVAFDGSSLPVSVAQQMVASSIAPSQININGLANICAAVDETNFTILWSYPEFNSSRNTKLLPFNYRAKRFAAEFWNPFDIWGMWDVEDTNGTKNLYFGGYSGYVYKWWSAGNDGLPVFTSPTYSQAVVADTPNNYWRFSEASGDAVATVGTRTINFSVFPGPAHVTYSVNNASILEGSTGLAFDGGATFGQNLSSQLNLGSTFTVEFWLNPAASGGFRGTILTDAPGNGIFYDDTVNKIDFRQGGHHYSTTALTPGTLYHIAVSVSAGNATFYVNGVADGTALGLAAFNSVTQVAVDNALASGLKCNLFDDLAIWTTVALSGAQVAAHYAARTGHLNTTAGTVTSATSSTLSDSAAQFSSSGIGFVDQYVYALNTDRTVVQRRRITATTMTQLTVTPNWDTTPNTSWTYVISAIDFQVDTPWLPGGDIFLKKRYEFFFGELASSDSGTTVDVDFFISGEENVPKKSFQLTLGNAGGVYDAATSIYDVTKFATSAFVATRKRLGFTGKNCRVRLRSCAANQDLVVNKLAVQSSPLRMGT